MSLSQTLARFLLEEAGVRPGDGIVAAFSGGADSTALLYGLTQVAPALGLELCAAHLDHGLDAGSAERAQRAAAAAERLGVRCEVERRAVVQHRRAGEGLEAEARRVRYEFLEQVRQRLGFRFIATAHHRDDQAETVLLRARFGSGPLGLAGIQRRRGAIVRPLLDLSRDQLRCAIETAGAPWIDDPTNADTARPRNLLRRVLAASAGQQGGGSLTRSEAADDLARRLAAIAARAGAARDRVDAALLASIEARREFDGASASLSAVRSLSSTLVSTALAALHRSAGLPYPASRRAGVEIERQMGRGGALDCDCGRGYGWEVRGSRLHLAPRSDREPTPVLFTYTLALPGEILVQELSLRFRLVPGPADPRVCEVSPRRAALALPAGLGKRLTVRNRRPGDRIRPLGWDTTCRVKDLLINRKVSRRERYRLPFLANGEDVIWIPGVALDERYRVTPGNPAWIAELEPIESTNGGPVPAGSFQPQTLRIVR